MTIDTQMSLNSQRRSISRVKHQNTLTDPVEEHDRAILHAAFEYASFGWPVFPVHTREDGRCTCGNPVCEQVAKHPRTPHGFKDATIEHDIIRWWWTQKWPGSNIGVATGRKSGLVVLDIDPRNGGDNSLYEIEKEFGMLPDTVVSQTGGGGRHIFFKNPNHHISCRLALRPGVDLKARGGYIIAPPSRHASGKIYRWKWYLKDIELTPLPEWLYQIILNPQGNGQPGTSQQGAQQILQGQRNNHLASLAGSMRRVGMTTDEIESALLKVNEDRCDPALDAHEVIKIAKSVSRYTPAAVLNEQSQILSDALKEEVPSERNLIFRTAREIAVSTPERPPWVVPGLLARGAITEVDGKIKAAGKTTFLAHLCSAVLEGKTFLDKPTEKTRVVYLTEQSDTTFREALARAGLLEREDFWILSWHDAVGVSWPDVVKAAVEKCHEVGASVLVVDTLGQWTGIRGSGENDAGEALAAIQPLQIATGIHNLAVATSRHERKSDGEVGDSGRGSSAFGGAVDIILSLRRPEGNSNPNIRVIHALSRFTETPDALAIELTNEGYIALGSGAAVALAQAKQAILDVAPVTQEAAKKEDELLDAAKAKRTTGREALNELMEAGLIERVGAGKRGDPYRYRATPEKDTDATQS